VALMMVAVGMCGCDTRHSNAVRTVKLDERALRGSALQSPPPVYPQESEQRHTQGVAVASVIIDSEGRMAQIDVLEAPDSAIHRSVHSALQKWTFRPIQVQGFPDTRWHVEGKLTFYFSMREGRGTVLSPGETAIHSVSHD
jgi:TonB family protein